MNRTLLFTMFSLVCLILATPLRAAKPLVISVSIPPQAYLVKAIGGSRVKVNTLVGVGFSPHDFEPRPRQAALVARSLAYFTIGMPFEKRLVEKLLSTNKKMKVVDLAKNVPRRRMVVACNHEHHHDGGCGIDHGVGAVDPHVWLSARNMLRMAPVVRDTLKALDAEGAIDYSRNCSKAMKDLLQVDAELKKRLAPYKGKQFYVFHPAFGYFADNYGLTQVPIEVEGKEPSARQLAQLIRRARKDKVKVIFVQRQFAQRAADKLAQAIGGTVIPLDPLAENYIINLRAIAKAVKKELKK